MSDTGDLKFDRNAASGLSPVSGGAMLLVFMLLPAALGCSNAPKRVAPAGMIVSGSIRASDVYSPGPRERIFESVSTKPSPGGGLQQRRTTTPADVDGAWSLIIDKPQRVAMGAKPGEWIRERELRVARTADGSVMMLRITDFEKKTTTSFIPPLILLPPILGGGAPFTAQSKLEVRDAGRSEKVTDRGEATLTATLESRGEHDATIFQTMLFEIGPAKVEQERVQRIAVDGTGLIAESESLRVKVGFITIKSKQAAWSNEKR